MCNHSRNGTFTTTGFPHQPYALAFLYGKTDTIHCRKGFFIFLEGFGGFYIGIRDHRQSTGVGYGAADLRRFFGWTP